MAIINKLNVSFNHNLIDNEYAFFQIVTSNKYINGGASILDKPKELLNVESIVFDNGKSLFMMFKKDAISRMKLVSLLDDDSLTIKTIYSENISDYILIRLFIYSLNNFESDAIKFNNITGKFYITSPNWINKNRKSFKALSINVNKDMYMSLDAVSFNQISLFKNQKVKDYPKYEFSNKNNSLKRSFDNSDTCFIRKSIYGKKAEIPFLDLKVNNIKNSKSYYFYKITDLLLDRFKNILSIDFDNVEIDNKMEDYIDKDFIDKSYQIIKNKGINLINWSNSSEFGEEFNDLKQYFLSKNLNVCESNKFTNDFNIVYLHNKEFYLQNGYKDPYKNFPDNKVIQHITIEDSLDKLLDNNEAVFNTILKELIIKNDIINDKKISLDNWANLNLDGDMIFGRIKNDYIHFMTISLNGFINFYTKYNDFSSFNVPILNECSSYLTDYNKESYIISYKNNIISIDKTNAFFVPSRKLFDLDTISRSKDSRNEYLDGIVDINLFNYNDSFCFNSGMKGSGMNTFIPKTSLIYKTEVLKGNNFIHLILKTMSVPFVKYNSFTVIPYPFKYLNEYIDIFEKKNIQI